MKTAVSSCGLSLAASISAPATATCPKCGGVVILKARKLMANGGNTYYWRHLKDDHPCERQKPFMRLRPAA
jgi:hypothetical protein